MHIPTVHLPRVHVPHRHAGRVVARSHAARSEEEHGLRVARSIAVFLVLSTVLFVGLWTLALTGSTEAGWWPAVVILAVSVVAAVGLWLTYWLDR